MEEFTADPYSITFTSATNTDYMPNPLQRHKSFNPMDKICYMIGLSLYQGSYTLLQFSERLSRTKISGPKSNFITYTKIIHQPPAHHTCHTRKTCATEVHHNRKI